MSCRLWGVSSTTSVRAPMSVPTPPGPGDGAAAALADDTGDRDGGLQQLGELLRDVQSEPGALVAGLRGGGAALERVEDPRPVRLGDARSGVAYLDPQRFPRP